MPLQVEVCSSTVVNHNPDLHATRTILSSIIGQGRALTQLARDLDRPNHAYLFVGPQGVGKRTTAAAWAQVLFCESKAGCTSCQECRKLGHGNHPDFHTWEPCGRSTSIDQIRELIRQAELAPYRGTHQVHVVDAESLTPAARNCLLKTLEEPKAGTILILLAQSLDDLLPTLVSRCLRVPFQLVDEALIQDWLEQIHHIDSRLAANAARRSCGRPGYALELVGRDEPKTALLFATDLLSALKVAESAAQLSAGDQILLLEDLITQTRDVVVLLRTGEQAWIGDCEAANALAATGRKSQSWLDTIAALESTRNQLLEGGQSRLAWSLLAGHVIDATRERRD